MWLGLLCSAACGDGGGGEEQEVACAPPASLGGCGSLTLPSSCSVLSLCRVTSSDGDEKLNSSLLVAHPGSQGQMFLLGMEWAPSTPRVLSRALDQLSALTPLLPFCISPQDNQELRTTKHPATSLCQEPPPALHVSARGSCPLLPPLPVEMWHPWLTPKVPVGDSKEREEECCS